uniref:GT1 family glycosyltransferase n=1 Tax=uncultured bacterium CSLC3 TaxID=1091572 RepID=G4WVU2_9BACT|nr:GT1 family glycosyltransferase [uncultured bacterium CSLC3]
MTEDHLTQLLPMRPFRALIARQIVICCNRIDLVIAPSQAVANQLPQRGIRTPIRYISNPVGFPDVTVEPLPREATFVIMFAGRLTAEKNLPYLLRGFHRLLDSIPEAVMWIAGEGTLRDQLQSQCRELGIIGQVRFLGFLGHDVLARYYASCDVFVLPSLVEIQPIVAMEAMWFGKPLILARSIVSAMELVEDGQSGFIVDQASDADLAQRLAELGSNPELRAKMGAAGRRKAEAYRPEVIVAALETAYHDTLSRLQAGSSQPARVS